MASEQEKEQAEWIEKQENLMIEGSDIVTEAVDEAIDYIKDVLENISDKEWRKMAMAAQPLEMGIGVDIVERLVPVVYTPMTKNMHKKLKIKKETARAVQHIFLGRVIKNIIRSYNARDTK